MLSGKQLKDIRISRCRVIFSKVENKELNVYKDENKVHLTMTIVQKGSNHISTAWRPRLASIQIGKHRCHHVVISAYPINTGTLFCIIMGHIKYMAFKNEDMKIL